MNILFIHQNFPGQFKHVAPALVKNGHDVAALTLKEFEGNSFKGITIFNYDLSVCTQTQVHPWLSDFQTKVIRADGCFQKAMSEATPNKPCHNLLSLIWANSRNPRNNIKMSVGLFSL